MSYSVVNMGKGDHRILAKQERTLRQSLENFQLFVTNYREQQDRSSLAMRLAKLDEVYDKFLDVRLQIEVITEDLEEADLVEPVESEVERKALRASLTQQRDKENAKVIREFENDYYAIKQALCALLTPAESSSAPGQSKLRATTSSEVQMRVKLPELKLPSFNGKLREWITFRDSFVSMIHDNANLASIDKFTYLRASLTGDALRDIASIELTAANYPIAWKTLQDSYENKKLIAKSYIDALFAVKPMEKESYDQLNRVVGEFETNLMMLEKLGENSDGMSTILQHMVCQRLDPNTLRNWENHYNSTDIPKYKDLIRYLKEQCMVLRSIGSARPSPGEYKKVVRSSALSHSGVHQVVSCPFCGDQPHSAFKCNRFFKMKVSERADEAKRKSLCLNCLSPGHIAKFCTKGSCHTCGRNHHTLLHSIPPSVSQSKSAQPCGAQTAKKNQPTPTPNSPPPQNSSKSPANNNSTAPQQTQNSNEANKSQNRATSASSSQLSTTDHASTSYNTVLSSTTQTLPNTVLLSTALINISDGYGNTTVARALLDSGSQLCFISEKFAQKMKFQRRRECLPIKGIGQAGTCSTQSITAWIRSRVSHYTVLMQFFVLPKVTAELPVRRIDYSRWCFPEGLPLADPEFYDPSAVDIIIGAEIFFDLIIDGQHKLAEGGPVLQNTQLGWVVSGKVSEDPGPTSSLTALACPEEKLDDLLTQFWELESCRTTSTQSLEESQCERIYNETTKRDSSGRFVVTLPKKPALIERLGESRSIALRRFISLERRLDSNPALKTAYSEFIHEYLEMGHMREVPVDPNKVEHAPFPYYLPHHAVLRPESTTTKLRVVFDGSCATTSGISLNDTLMVGPVVQEDLLSIVLRFRLHKFAIVADIAKMYRMVNIAAEDQSLQRILWRDSSSEPIRTFELTTVTYGTSSAPYLATKCLQRLADEGAQEYPLAAMILSKDFYVDDMLSGAKSVEEGIKMYHELSQLLETSKFTLRKWSSNSQEILAAIPEALKDDRTSLELDSPKAAIKTLGLSWEPRSDEFRFSVPQWSESTEINKRIILSDFARLFDPLGLVGPVVVQAKIFLQDLWKQKCSWNEALSEDLQQWWLDFRQSLAELSSLKVPRWLAFGSDTVSAEIHGFCDASEKAYGACVYLRSTSFDGHVSISLMIAKSRVAPLDDVTRRKKKMSIPRLELSSAVVLSHVYEKVVNSLRIKAQPFFWTDSTIVKCWLSSSPSRWQMFVANRVSEIQHLTRAGQWNHIAGSENPADVISRGMTPGRLADHPTWWSGPEWLRSPRNFWPKEVSTNAMKFDQALLEEKPVVAAPVQHQPFNDFFKLRSTFSALIRVTALCRRFIFNCQNPTNVRKGYLSFQEREDAMLVLVRIAQNDSFAEEKEALVLKRQVSPSSRLKTLYPTLSNGILVVGGRLAHAPISPGRKHPIILDNRHPLTLMVVEHYHRNLLHAGPQLLIASIRERFWPLHLKNLTRKVVHSCVPCFRVKPKVQEQLMGDLPPERVAPALPFVRVGVDYCGPFKIRFPHRKTDIRICYVVIFICLVTKAVHIDMVADQTTEGFIAALRRLVARRGRPEIIMCDNARYFIGAKRELDQLRRLFNSQAFTSSIPQAAANEGINFRFIPPRSPNFGGLWEAAVKSLKYHLKRTIGTNVVTPDEFYTLLTQIEACLNSRPLTPVSNDPSDLEILTPGHFLIHRPLTAVLEPSLEDLKENRLSKWQRVQRYLQTIWKKWSTSYLSDLQNRTKWVTRQNNLAENMMVLLKDDNQPPLRWPLGRIVAIHPGKDGNVRVVEVRTKDGLYTRAVSKICVLPIQDNECSLTSSQRDE